jgi:Hedgehog amino-terminal signalling domain
MSAHLLSRWRVWLSLTLALTTLTACAPDPLGDLPTERATPTPQVVVALVSAVPSLTPLPTLNLTPVLTPPHELGAGQHLSSAGSYAATETEAAGPMVCQIQRGSAAFQHLANDFDPRLLFSGGDPASFPDENHMINAAILVPLDTLIGLVGTEWGGKTQIMVTAAYDSVGKHDLAQPAASRKYSLHFEGRSVDLIPWPPDLAQIARLCALAHIAGFDWVHNEEDHCHASVNTQSLCDLYNYRVSS